MRILIATPLYPPETSAPAPEVERIADALGETHDVHVVAYANTPTTPQNHTLAVVKKHAALISRLIAFTATLFRESSRGDVLYAERAVAAGLPALIVSKLRGIPLYVHFFEDEAWERALQLRETTDDPATFLHTGTFSSHIRRIFRIQKFVLSRADHVLVPSSARKTMVSDVYTVPPEHITVLYDALPPAPVLPFSTARVPRKLYVDTRLVPWAGLDTLLLALPDVVTQIPDVTLTITGVGPCEEALKARTEELGLSGVVSFLGRAAHAEVAWHMRTASLILHPTTYCDTPTDLFPALQSSTPVLAADTAGVRELITAGADVNTYPAEDAAKLAAQIIAHLQDGEKNTPAGAELFHFDVHVRTLTAIMTKNTS